MKALVAMSGGIDSSMAAVLMKKKGYEVVGVTMKLHDESADIENTCCSSKDIEDARKVAEDFGFEYEVINFEDRFRECVIDKFVNCYKCGATPNPCVDCNRYLKFDALFKRAEELECDVVVTGHYARVKEENGKYKLLAGVDEQKDQSYVLYHLTQKQLEKIKFPLGDYTKEEIREMAKSAGLESADKKESQDICFIPDGNHKKFIENYTGEKIGPGDFLDINEKKVGTHQGYYRYTIGQRRGVDVSRDGRNYVLEIRPKTNEVVIGRNKDLFKSSLVANDFNWICGSAPTESIEVLGRTRYHKPLAEATLKVLENGNVEMVFDEPQRAMTKGQAVVIYDGDEVIGGGTIIE